MPENPLQRRRRPIERTSRAIGLSRGGMFAALLIGGAALAAGGAWAILLVVFFVAATVVSRYRGAVKLVRARGVPDKTGARDPLQVLANGGAFAVGAVAAAVTTEPVWAAFAVGALAASSADTWATELGLLSPHAPRSAVSWQKVLPGSSGGVTLAGTVAGLTGAAVVTLAAAALSLPASALAILIGGVSGMFVDSVLGAAFQERRWCAACERSTERRTHSCGAATARVGGIRGLTNDAVNAVATVAGGCVAAALWQLPGWQQ